MLLIRPLTRLPPLRYTTPRLRHSSTHKHHHDASLDISTFGNLAPWALSHLSPETSPSSSHILIRHHASEPYIVQRALLHTTCRFPTAANAIANEESTTSPPEILDLTAHPTHAGLMFLYWLFHRILPREGDCALLGEDGDIEDVEVRRRMGREMREHFTWGLVASWVLGSRVRAVGFQNDVMRLVAGRLAKGEVEVSKSRDPHDSRAIAWARRAFDYSSEMEVEQTNLAEFAVDVAAKRVYDVGMNGLALTTKEKETLSTNATFAREVFGSLAGQIGTKGVGIQDFARAYLVEEDGQGAGAL